MKLVVLGAAGGAIARTSAAAGHDVVRGRDGLQRRTASVAGSHDRGAGSRRADTGIDGLDDPSRADLVIETGSGDPSAERIAAVEAAAGGAVIASTAPLSPLAEVASALERPEHAVGLRFSTPIDLLEFVEVVVTERTDGSAVELVEEFVESLGKEPVVIRDGPGLVASRSGVAIGVEAIRMVERGVASPRAIDRTMELGYEYSMGPLELVDRIGLDTYLEVLEDLSEEFGERFRPPRLLERKVRAGDLGRETGEGFYVWEDGERVGTSDV